MVEEVDGLEDVVVPVALTGQVGTKDVEANFAGLAHVEAMDVRLLARPRSLALLLVEVDLEADLAVKVLGAPGQHVAVPDEVVTDGLLDSLRLPDTLDEATLVVTLVDQHVVLVDLLGRVLNHVECVETDLDGLPELGRGGTSGENRRLVVGTHLVPCQHTQVQVLVDVVHGAGQARRRSRGGWRR